MFSQAKLAFSAELGVASASIHTGAHYLRVRVIELATSSMLGGGEGVGCGATGRANGKACCFLDESANPDEVEKDCRIDGLRSWRVIIAVGEALENLWREL